MPTPTLAVRPSAATVRRSAGRRAAWVAVLAGAVLVAVVASVMFGARPISGADALAGLFGARDSVEQAAAAARVPRTLLGLLVGAALAMAGTTMQAVTRNPLADPGIFGVLSGASLAVVVGIAFFALSRPIPTMAVATAGAAIAAAFVYTVGSLGRGGATPLKLALAGAATSAALTSLISAVLLPRVDVLDTFRFWQVGGVGGASYERMRIALPLLLLGALICVACAGGLNSLALGDDLATALGEHVARTRALASIGAVLLCGVATATAGPIAFVGLVVPHVCRLVIGTDHRWLLPVSALAGAGLVVAADTLGRVVTRPSEVAVGIIMPVLGAPVFIAIVRRSRVRDL